MRDRDRIFKDETAAEALLIWGKRHNDPFAQAMGLARMGEHPERWEHITALAPNLSPSDITSLNKTLAPWPNTTRSAPTNWALPQPLPCLLIARSLSMPYKNLSAADALSIARSPYVAYLSHLDLSDNVMNPAGARALAESPHLSALTSLNLWGCFISEEGALAIAHSPYLQNLTRLDLAQNHIGTAAAHALANAPQLKSLTHLNLSHNDIDTDGIRAIAQNPHFASLTSLNLSQNNMDADGARALTQSPYLSSLLNLDLSDNNLSDEAARAVAQSNTLPHLITLDLSGNDIGDDGACAIANAPHLAHLTSLKIGNDDARVQMRSPRFRRETYTMIGAQGAHALALSPFLNENIRNECKVFVYTQLLRCWRAESIDLGPPASPEAITQFEQTNNLQLTDELKTLLSFADGFLNGDCCQKTFRFLTLNNFINRSNSSKYSGKYVMIVNYMDWSWGYAVNVDPESEHLGAIFQVGGAQGVLNKIADNLEDFLYLYMADDQQIYGG